MPTPLPELPGAVVHRPRLSRLLDGPLPRPVTLLTAPPGWGKTAALRSWLDHRANATDTSPSTNPSGTTPTRASPERVVWISLDPADPWGTDVPTRVAQVEQDLGSDALATLVVFDDLQLGDAAVVSRTLDRLVRLAGSQLRLILATRDNSGLPVPRWRLRDQMTEIGCADLAFTRDETAHMLAVHQVTLTMPEIEALHERTEGWPAGVRFAALNAASADPLAGERHDVTRYLEAEVLGRLPARVRALLVRTSVLDRMCGDLADDLVDIPATAEPPYPQPPAIAERTHPEQPHPEQAHLEQACRTYAERELEQLSAAGGFVLPLGGTPPWYRYHRQLRETLRAELRRTRAHQVDHLHARAAAWLSRHGLPVDAMRHGWACGDRDRVASLSQAEWSVLALSGCHVSATDRESVSCDDPDLAAAYVVDRLGRGDARVADAGQVAVYSVPGQPQRSNGHRGLSTLGHQVQAGIDGSAVALLELTEADGDAHHEVDPRYLRVRAVALAAQAAALLGAGDLDASADALAEFEPIPNPPNPNPSNPSRSRPNPSTHTLATPNSATPNSATPNSATPNSATPNSATLNSATMNPAAAGPVCARRAVAGIRALLLALSGDLHAAESGARSALAVPPCQGQPHDVHCEPAYLALAVVSHEWARPAEAERFFDLAGRAHQLTVEPELAAWTTLIGAWLRAARGELTAALEFLRAGRLAAGATGIPVRVQPWFAAAEADLRIAHGDTRTARATLTTLLADAGEGDAALAVPLARALLRDGDPHGADRTLPPWSDDEKAETVLSVRLDAGLIEAQVARALGDRRRASQTLERVLDLAEPQGFRRPFAKDADGLRDLLADQLECGTAHWSTVAALIEQPRARPAGDAATVAGEPLTDREVTVLRYLQSMLSNEEIAAKLFVSINTVKTHVRHIYRKLDVSHRRDAVRRARDLRLL